MRIAVLRRAGHPLLVSLAVLLATLAPVALRPLRPDMGAVARLQDGRWVIARVEPKTIADEAGLRTCDIVLGLDGAPPATARVTDPGLDLGSAREWTLLRRGETIIVWPDQAPSYPQHLIESLILPAIALAFWGLATLVRLKKPTDELAGRFYWLNLAAAVVLGLAPAAPDDILWAKAIEVAAFAILPALFLGFFLWFADGHPPAGRASVALKGLYVVGPAIGALYFLAGIVGSPWYDALRAALLALLAVGFIGGTGALARAYRRPRSESVRRQAGVVLLGTAVAIAPPTVFCLLPGAAGWPAAIPPQIAALGNVALPSSFAYAILRRRLLDVDSLIERTLLYGLMTLLVAGCYGLFICGLSMVGPIAEGNPVLTLAFFAAVTLTFVPVRDGLRGVIDHLIYRDRYDYAHTLRSLGMQLASLQPIDEVLARVAKSLAGAMNLTGAAVLLRDAEGEFAIRAASGRCAGVEAFNWLIARASRAHDDGAWASRRALGTSRRPRGRVWPALPRAEARAGRDRPAGSHSSGDAGQPGRRRRGERAPGRASPG